MTSMTQVNGLALTPLTVGQVAEQYGVTVRTLHHYDEIGLLAPGERTSAGYRLYSDKDIARLQHVVVYRRLGFALEEIALLLDDASADLGEHLRRQRDVVMSRLDEMHELVTAIDRALEKEMSGTKLTKEEQKELFGDGFSDEYAEEAEQRWGETEAWKQSQRRTSTYTKEDWAQVKAEMDATNGGLRVGDDRWRACDQRASNGRRRAAPPAHPQPVLRPHARVPSGPRRHVSRGPAVHEDLRGHQAGDGAVRPGRHPCERRPCRGGPALTKRYAVPRTLGAGHGIPLGAVPVGALP